MCGRVAPRDSGDPCPDCAAVSAAVASRPDLAARILRERFGYCVIAMRPRTYAAAAAAAD
jgi:hypothetical protein